MFPCFWDADASAGLGGAVVSEQIEGNIPVDQGGPRLPPASGSTGCRNRAVAVESLVLNQAGLKGGNEARVPAGTSTPPTACTSKPTTLLRPTVHLLVVTRTRPLQRPEGFTTVLTLLLDTEVLG